MLYIYEFALTLTFLTNFFRFFTFLMLIFKKLAISGKGASTEFSSELPWLYQNSVYLQAIFGHFSIFDFKILKSVVEKCRFSESPVTEDYTQERQFLVEVTFYSNFLLTIVKK